MKNSFIEKMAVLYQAVPSSLLVSVRIAQACVESSYGQSELALNANNYAGIKASDGWTGAVYEKVSDEYIDGKMVPKKSNFRKYETIEQFVKDHSNFITSTEWRKNFYAEVINATTYQGQCAALTNTYATSSKYGAELIKVIEQYNLTQYDKGADKMAIQQPKILNKDFYAGTAGKRPTHKPKYYILHNDAGSATGAGYEGWLRSARTPYTDKAASGFAHYYISADSILRAESTANATWSTASYDGNVNSIGYEVCQQLSATDAQFRANEEMTLRQMAEDMTYYGDTPNAQNIKFHNEFTSTSCPKRSDELHGGREGLRQYVIERIKYYQSLGKTVREMIDAENAGKGGKIETPTPEHKPKLSLTDVARLVIKGSYGNGQARVSKLQAEGYNPTEVQKEVDRLRGKRMTKKVEPTNAGTYRFNTTVNVRTGASTNSTVVAQYKAGETVNIDKVVQAQGYDWGEYRNYGGGLSYVALGVTGGERYTTKVK